MFSNLGTFKLLELWGVLRSMLGPPLRYIIGFSTPLLPISRLGYTFVPYDLQGEKLQITTFK
jgi:hypothetical protein